MKKSDTLEEIEKKVNARLDDIMVVALQESEYLRRLERAADQAYRGAPQGIVDHYCAIRNAAKELADAIDWLDEARRCRTQKCLDKIFGKTRQSADCPECAEGKAP